ncbi:hypothetical protein HK099_004305 [Clydaea vesicula]|uniref:CHY-type domain-containing protein n=1 Tax=Clydaea vesicula TaxID=447962 RepID=A0AAD5XZI3_9FUNG|nr:hypothetical protein HK099_004305 [Clydaea vesicula]
MKKGDGLIVGESLPKSGTCKHYKRSYRWFRFPCCSKLFPCDECHHELSLDCKENILANRVVCGFCSREQKFDAKNSICICGKDMSMSSAGKSFWEGGKGNRNKSKMSKNDSKKYTGLSKTVSKKKLK